MPLEILHRAAPCHNVPVTFTLELIGVVVRTLAASCLIFAAGYVQAAEFPVLAETFLRPVMIGMHESFGESLARGRITVTQYLCLKAVPPETLAPTVVEILRDSLSESELVQAEEFFSSQVGRRYAQAAMAAVPQEPPPELSLPDQTAIAEFAQSPAGLRLIRDAALESRESKVKLGRSVREVAEQCRNK